MFVATSDSRIVEAGGSFRCQVELRVGTRRPLEIMIGTPGSEKISDEMRWVETIFRPVSL
jgi:hypothetical protein